MMRTCSYTFCEKWGHEGNLIVNPKRHDKMGMDPDEMMLVADPSVLILEILFNYVWHV